jgi:hypothetical protein
LREAHSDGNAEASLREEVEGVNRRCGWMGGWMGAGKRMADSRVGDGRGQREDALSHTGAAWFAAELCRIEASLS